MGSKPHTYSSEYQTTPRLGQARQPPWHKQEAALRRGRDRGRRAVGLGPLKTPGHGAEPPAPLLQGTTRPGAWATGPTGRTGTSVKNTASSACTHNSRHGSQGVQRRTSNMVPAGGSAACLPPRTQLRGAPSPSRAAGPLGPHKHVASSADTPRCRCPRRFYSIASTAA